MAKVKIPLVMKNGEKAKDMESLREHFDVETVVGYFLDGKLSKWLDDRYYEEEAEAVTQLEKDDPQLASKLCSIFGVEYTGGTEMGTEEIMRRKERQARLLQLTEDEEILRNINSVAFNQEELAELYDRGVETIYLCEGKFKIPKSKKGLTYQMVAGAEVSGLEEKVIDDSYRAIPVEFADEAVMNSLFTQNRIYHTRNYVGYANLQRDEETLCFIHRVTHERKMVGYYELGQKLYDTVNKVLPLPRGCHSKEAPGTLITTTDNCLVFAPSIGALRRNDNNASYNIATGEIRVLEKSECCYSDSLFRRGCVYGDQIIGYSDHQICIRDLASNEVKSIECQEPCEYIWLTPMGFVRACTVSECEDDEHIKLCRYDVSSGAEVQIDGLPEYQYLSEFSLIYFKGNAYLFTQDDFEYIQVYRFSCTDPNPAAELILEEPFGVHCCIGAWNQYVVVHNDEEVGLIDLEHGTYSVLHNNCTRDVCLVGNFLYYRHQDDPSEDSWSKWPCYRLDLSDVSSGETRVNL